ncbi:GEVED domain-containing protein [Polluticoccus soli]|uniref:T9SS type A sorting domain-containing protein n=1 Tax=Polluticoccus soli TaxID=3034150 RepID=UPI0023E220DB|nr:GEVED domain-containing protein [Flavipsychrobacter sp. JY13-12]
MKKLYTFCRITALSTLLFSGSLKSNGQYCITNLYLTGCTNNDYIRSFRTSGGMGDIMNPSTGCSNTTNGYTYYSALSHTTSVGNNVNFSIVNNPFNNENYYFYVDWNADGDFTDAGETITTGTVPAGDSVTGSFPVPPGTTLGTKRMRARFVFNPTTPVTACSQENYGEIEDYNLNIVAPAPPCNSPSNATVSNITGVTADMTWTAVPGAIGYEWAITTSPTPPSSGTGSVTGTAIGTNTLTPNTTYYFHLRTKCSGFNQSSGWVTKTFTTTSAPACTAPSNFKVNDVTTNSVQFSWSPSSTAISYEYAITTTTNPPTTGIPTTQLSASISLLNSATKYYVRVRSICSASTYSGWLLIPIFTHFSTSVNEVNNDYLNIYPSPASDKLTIESAQSADKAIIQLIDVSGRMVMEQGFGTSSTTLDISKLQPGIYILKYLQGPTVSIQRIVKQ